MVHAGAAILAALSTETGHDLNLGSFAYVTDTDSREVAAATVYG